MALDAQRGARDPYRCSRPWRHDVDRASKAQRLDGQRNAELLKFQPLPIALTKT
jgi:hypothetical protein